MSTLAFQSLNEAQQGILDALLRRGVSVSPRGLPTREIQFFNFAITNPRKRLLTLTGRHWDIALAIGEFCWHLAASSDASFISYYAQAWNELATENCTIPGSSYGRSIFVAAEGLSQWELAQKLLRIDPASRRAILFFNLAKGRLAPETRDVACASSLQFLIREGRLDAIVSMRSNDAILGLPYDVFFFSMLQEMMALELGSDLGVYYHSAGSLHLYERHIALAERTLSGGEYGNSEMLPMKDLPASKDLLKFEEATRLNQRPKPDAVPNSPYWRAMADVLAWHRMRLTDAKSAVISEGPYSHLLRHMAKG